MTGLHRARLQGSGIGARDMVTLNAFSVEETLVPTSLDIVEKADAFKGGTCRFCSVYSPGMLFNAGFPPLLGYGLTGHHSSALVPQVRGKAWLWRFSACGACTDAPLPVSETRGCANDQVMKKRKKEISLEP